MKTANTIAMQAKTFSMSESRLEDVTNRVRIPLLEVLQERWWNPRSRPVLRNNSVSPVLLSLLKDILLKSANRNCLSKKPSDISMGRIMALGSRMRLLSARSLLTTASLSPSITLDLYNDYEIHKLVFQTYGEYLHMTPEELTRAGFEGGQHFCQILTDKGYTVPADNTEPLERVVPRKGRGLSEEDLARNRQIVDERVFVEQFFGRLSHL
jgi:hypothetical protein